MALSGDDKQFQLRVRDDGKGIDPTMVDEPRAGVRVATRPFFSKLSPPSVAAQISPSESL
jgi:hypothetical protein